MPIPYLGELAALGTSICFSFGPTHFTLAGRQVGSVVVNRSRLVAAALFLLTAHWLIYGAPVPLDAGGERWGWFAISGVIGFALGDAALFQAFVMLGAQLTLLVFATTPVISAILGWVFFQETLTGLQMAGILVTLGGVAWVIVGQENDAQKNLSKKDYLLGVLFAFLGAAGQALGLFTSKKGLVGGFPALSGQIIRVLAAVVVIWVWTFAVKKGKQTVQTLRENPQALKYILIASFNGPVLGVWFSLVSIQNTDLGIASTLQSLPPVFLIPIDYFLFKEKVTWQSIAGTLIALGGVAILFLT